MEAIFETNPVFLSGLLGDLKTGKIQLPDFQRGWVWEDERICGLLASVSRSFPIGALMMLETGGEARFHPRPVEGVDLTKDVDPELLVLDGQQRLTSLFQATTYGKVVATTNIRKEPIKRWFYFDMQRARASAEDREDAIIGVPEDRILRTLTEEKLNLSTREKEFEHLCFPCEKLFDTFEWQNGYLQYWKFDPAKTELFMRFQADVLQRFLLLDALSLRELPIIVVAARDRGLTPSRVEALGSQVPSDTDRFAAALGVSGRSKLFNNQPPASFIFSGPDVQATTYQDFLRRFDLRWFAGLKIQSPDELWCLSIQSTIAA